MRRILFTVLAAAALCVAAPTVALAHGHHHKRHHHNRVRHEFFKGRHDNNGSGNSSGSTSQPTAGTVTSFANNVLTITLNDGSTVSGAVTNDSQISCENPDMQNGDNDGDDNGGGDDHGDAVFHRGDGGPGGWSGGDNGGGNNGGGDNGGDNGNDQTCTPMPGMAVTRAELSIDGNGASWNEVDLVNSSTSTTTGSQP